jgi:PAS domain S-box-containing protein
MTTANKEKSSRQKFAEDKYFNLIEHAADGITILQDGVFKLVNTTLACISGYDKGELLGMPFAKLLTPESQKLAIARYQARLAGKKVPTIYEVKALTKDGETRNIELNAALTEYEGRVADEVIIRDITERKQAAEKLRESEERYRSLTDDVLDSSRVGIFILDSDFRIVWVNRALERYFGLRRDEIIGKDKRQLIHKRIKDVFEDPKGFAEKVLATYDKNTYIENFECHVLPKGERQERWLEHWSQPIKTGLYAGGRIEHYTDITERKQTEERERQLQQELNLSSRLASIGQMASGIAHEINNPLTGVIGFSQLLTSKDIPDDMAKDIEVIHSEAQRVAKIVEGLLAFARQHKPGRNYVDINDIITQVLRLRSYEMKANNIQVETGLAHDLPVTMADAGQLHQVFLNIVLNAEKEMINAHGRGKLIVKTEQTGDKIRISFTDDGPGISKENLDKIFDPFFSTRAARNGTGLGLSICHGIITQHNGRIYATSKPGKGATFIIELPVVADNEEAEKTEVIREEPWQRIGAKILVVDDEPAILSFLKELLTNEGYQVETLERADDALEKLRNQRYDLIMLDIKLPVMSGIELYRHIEKTKPTMVPKVLFITGDMVEPSTRDFLEKTKASYITKPFNMDHLKKEANHVLTKFFDNVE